MPHLSQFKAFSPVHLLSRAVPLLVAVVVLPLAAGEPVAPTPPTALSKKAPSGVFVVNTDTKKSETSRKYSSDREDVSAVFVSSSAQLSLFSPNISTTGETSSPVESRTQGLNAAVLATQGASVTISGGSIVSTGSGATAAQALGPETKIALSGTKIVTSGDGAHGAIAAGGASLSLTEADIEVAAAEAAGVTAEHEGTVVAVGCGVTTTGPRSPTLNASGSLTAGGGTYKALLAHGAQIRSGGSLSAKNISLTASRLCGVLLYSEYKGADPDGPAKLAFEGGVLTTTEGPAFFVTNTAADLSLSNVSISAVSGVLLRAGGSEWGQSGDNGGRASLTARQQLLVGDVLCDAISSVTVELQEKSTLTGKITGASLSLDSTSTWTVTGDSLLVDFTTAANSSGGTIPNVRGNGHTVRYNSGTAANKWLNGKVYKLADGGTLEPAP